MENNGNFVSFSVNSEKEQKNGKNPQPFESIDLKGNPFPSTLASLTLAIMLKNN